ncbi:MAG: DUF1800 domain-containing protein, partial [Acidobacteria bacterium]|nr:DUF1800 domain-containing protein [Acidobacteriota bacterium]
VKRIGIERFLEEQLNPDVIIDDFLSRPLLALNTLQMTVPDTIQLYSPMAARPTPTPTPAPAPAPAPSVKPPFLPDPSTTSKEEAEGEMKKEENVRGEMNAGQNNRDIGPDQRSMPQEVNAPVPAPTQTVVQAKPTPSPKPAPQRDGQQPLRELQQAKLLRAVFSEKQLQEVMVDFWFNHFNVFGGKDTVRWMVTSYERDVIRPHALGNFKELLVAVAQSPAMLYYLDNFLSQAEVRGGERESGKMGELRDGSANSLSPTSPVSPSPTPPPRRRPGLNENFARELMELHTLGVDGGYTQQDVIEVARCFTGWTITNQPNSTFVFRPRTHDRGEKVVLGTRILAGGGIEDGLRVIELLAKHRSTAKFIARKLSQRFVADEPPGSLIDRVAEVFMQSSGDIRMVVRAILTSPEFYSPIYYRNKIKSPLELAASAIRATGASTDAAAPLIQWVTRMGEPLYLCQAPTGYSEESSRWMSNATLLLRMNFALALIGNKINGTRVDLSRLANPDALRNKDRLIDQLVVSLIHSDISRQTRENLERVFEQSHEMLPSKSEERANKKNYEQMVSGLAALVLGAGEFQVK